MSNITIVAVEFPQGDDDPIVEHFGPFNDEDEADVWVGLIQAAATEKGMTWRFHITRLESPWHLASSLISK